MNLNARTLIVCVLAVLSGAMLLYVSQQVQQAENDLAHVKREINQEQETLRVLRAEWSYLNNPDYLEDLAHDYLDLVPLDSVHLSDNPDIVPPQIPTELDEKYDAGSPESAYLHTGKRRFSEISMPAAEAVNNETLSDKGQTQ